MSNPNPAQVHDSGGLSRRAALKIGSAAAGGALLAGLPTSPALGEPSPVPSSTAGLPLDTMERIIGAKGTVSDGVLSIEIDRDDIHNVHNSLGYLIKPSFQVNGTVVFQSDGMGGAILNGDLAFRPEELQRALDAMQSHGLIFQAMHQHFYDWTPMVWFMHFRGRGDARLLARGISAILATTSTPVPQAPPKNPTTPLNTARLAQIMRSTPSVGADGVVTFEIPRKEPITLAASRINHYLNVASSVAFEPLNSTTAVAPDFGMVAGEVQPLTQLMRSLGWQIGCLYNQETAENPQLYFSHTFKAGNAYALADEVRRGLDLMNVQGS